MVKIHKKQEGVYRINGYYTTINELSEEQVLSTRNWVNKAEEEVQQNLLSNALELSNARKRVEYLEEVQGNLLRKKLVIQYLHEELNVQEIVAKQSIRIYSQKDPSIYIDVPGYIAVAKVKEGWSFTPEKVTELELI